MILRVIKVQNIVKILRNTKMGLLSILHELKKCRLKNKIYNKQIPVKNLPKLLAASTTALYPAIFAMELNASNTCARLILGIQSTAKVFRCC